MQTCINIIKFATEIRNFIINSDLTGYVNRH